MLSVVAVVKTNVSGETIVVSISEPRYPTVKQREALELGQRIRNITCMDSIARRHFDPVFWPLVRSVCDQQMHLLGYESITEHEQRRDKFWAREESVEAANKWSNYKFAQFFKYQRLDTNAN